MDNVKTDLYYLKRVIKDLGFIIEQTAGITLWQLQRNEVLCDSVLFRLIQISENASKLTLPFKEAHRDIPWQAIKGMRNRIVHDYGEVDLSIIYQTVTEDIPALYEQIQGLV